jgi:hypothetical protein
MSEFVIEMREPAASGIAVVRGIGASVKVGDRVGVLSAGGKGVGEAETTRGETGSSVWVIDIDDLLVEEGDRLQAANKMSKRNVLQPFQRRLTASRPTT